LRAEIFSFSLRGYFGFGRCGGEEFYFHASGFVRLKPGGPYPIAGEPVEVDAILEQEQKSPVAEVVRRIEEPLLLRGEIQSFDHSRGWGFIRTPDTDERIFLHKSDVLDNWIPAVGSSVAFYKGCRNGQLRACWAQPGGHSG